MLGTIAILFAIGAAGWLLLRVGGKSEETKSLFRLKVVGLLAIAAVCLAAKLFPIAFMILLAAGAVTAIEVWSGRAIKGLDQMTPGAGVSTAPRAPLSVEEAAAVLGVEAGAGEEEIKAAHKKLIAQLHPDKGGNDYLAAKINDARTLLLARRARAKETPEA